jgi:hypothetical protein
MPLTEESETLTKEIDAWKKRWGEHSAHMHELKNKYGDSERLAPARKQLAEIQAAPK